MAANDTVVIYGGTYSTDNPLNITKAAGRFNYNERMLDYRDVDPRELRVPPSRRQGADPAKLARQIALFGRSAAGMPAPWVYEGTDGGPGAV